LAVSSGRANAHERPAAPAEEQPQPSFDDCLLVSERRMRGFRDPERTQSFLLTFARFRSTSRSSDIYCGLRSVANNSPNALLHGIASPNSPIIRLLHSKSPSAFATIASVCVKLTKPSSVVSS
jgi:hypothetical protein